MFSIQWVTISDLQSNPRNARLHPEPQIRRIAKSIAAFGFLVPLLVARRVVIAGEGRLRAAQLLGLKQVPVIELQGLSEAQLRALALADNKVAEGASWDRERLAIELPALAEIIRLEGLEFEITGFDAVELDELVTDFSGDPEHPSVSPAPDFINTSWVTGVPVTQPGDRWALGAHVLSCGDPWNVSDLRQLIGRSRAATAIIDAPPPRLECSELWSRVLGAAAAVTRPGALHFVFARWQHLRAVLNSGASAYDELITIGVWLRLSSTADSTFGDGHELLAIYRSGRDPQTGGQYSPRRGRRTRPNVWHQSALDPVLDTVQPGQIVRPTALLQDLIEGATRRNDTVFDPFAGAGTTLLATELVGRRALSMEAEPRLVDVAVRRWAAFTGGDAVHLESGLSFNARARQRQAVD